MMLDLGVRPRCATKGCNKPCQFMGSYRKDGTPYFRKLCSTCHCKKTAEKRGMNSMADVLAANAGFESTIAYINHKHPYRKHRKDYCENKDGRLGFKCRVKIRHTAQLQVDHINGNPEDNRVKNLQTLCACCHIYKTHMEKDYKTPGRKKLNIKY